MQKPFKYGVFLFLAIFAISFLVNLLFALIIKNQLILSSAHVLIILFSAIVISFITSILVILTTPILRDFLITYRTLLRLEALSHPLLRRLSTEASGTYNHSIMVANLSNKAARALGADSLLARVGGYYHDVGKLVKPEMFIENQTNIENRHEELDPKKSAKIIINHVKEGIKLAKENRLPDEVISLIASHHGTTLIGYFYEKALLENPRVKKAYFQYPGPKPMSKEAAIIMLADAIEAKTRLIKNITIKDIREVVEDTIRLRFDEKQFELSGLTSGDVNKIKNTFIDTLAVIFHQRIDYPKTGFLRYSVEKNEK
ncbi:MAG: HDIG domain-containing protein [Patescibacteria group bacterium]|nr:HDIG domain-containing protein [Patescibacteria group bacterium]